MHSFCKSIGYASVGIGWRAQGYHGNGIGRQVDAWNPVLTRYNLRALTVPEDIPTTLIGLKVGFKSTLAR